MPQSGWAMIAGKEVGEIDQAGGQEHPLHHLIGPAQHQPPGKQRRQGQRDIFAHPEQLHAGGDPGKFAHDVAHVAQEQPQHGIKGDLDAEALPGQVGQPFAGDRAHAGAHLLDDHQGQDHGDEEPEDFVAQDGAGHGIGGNAAGIVVHVGGDDARPHDRQEDE